MESELINGVCDIIFLMYLSIDVSLSSLRWAGMDNDECDIIFSWIMFLLQIGWGKLFLPLLCFRRVAIDVNGKW